MIGGKVKFTLLHAIGDAYSDYEASKNAHIDFGLAKWGSVATQEIPATLVFKQPKDLLRLLKK